MPRITPDAFATSDGTAIGLSEAANALGFLPNSMAILSRRPHILQALGGLSQAVMGQQSSIDSELRNLIAQMASRAAGCTYCIAHTAHSGSRMGLSEQRADALWEYQNSPLFTDAERIALRVANLAALVPNAVTDADFDALKLHYSEDQIVDIVCVIALFGFFNRYNDTLATELESSPMQTANRLLANKGWTAGKHAPDHASA